MANAFKTNGWPMLLILAEANVSNTSEAYNEFPKWGKTKMSSCDINVTNVQGCYFLAKPRQTISGMPILQGVHGCIGTESGRLLIYIYVIAFIF